MRNTELAKSEKYRAGENEKYRVGENEKYGRVAEVQHLFSGFVTYVFKHRPCRIHFKIRMCLACQSPGFYEIFQQN